MVGRDRGRIGREEGGIRKGREGVRKGGRDGREGDALKPVVWACMHVHAQTTHVGARACGRPSAHVRKGDDLSGDEAVT